MRWIKIGLCRCSIIGFSHGWSGWAVDSSTIDIEEVDEGGEGGSLGSTVGAACGEEDGEEESSLEEASWERLNFSKSERSSSIFNSSSAMVGPWGDCEGDLPEGGLAAWVGVSLDVALDWACCERKCTSMLFWYNLT